MFVEKGVLDSEQIAKLAIFCGFVYLTNLFKSVQESENMCQ